MGLWSAILPRASINLRLNPSFEIDTDQWQTGGGNTLTRSNEQSFKGGYSAKIAMSGAQSNILADQFVQTLVANKRYYTHCWIYVPSGWDGGTIYWDAENFTGATETINHQWTASDDNDRWFYVELQIDLSSDNTGSFTLKSTGTATAGKIVYVDAIMLEQQDDTPTTYVDGDQDGCKWNKAKHASTSQRIAQSRSGGYELDLETYKFYLSEFEGVGMPPMDHQVIEQALLDGAVYQGSKALSRHFLLTGEIIGDSLTDFHLQRKNIINAILPNRFKGAQPVLFRYSGASDKNIEIAAVYDRGLDFQGPHAFSERVALRLAAHDPYFYEIGEISHHLTLSETLSTKYIAAKISGDWDTLGPPSSITNPGSGISVYTIVQDDSKVIFVGGEFLNWDGEANADYIAKWDGSAWASIGSGMNGDVRTLAKGPDGSIYVGGNFTLANGVSHNYIAKITGGTTFVAMGTGMNALVEDIVVGLDGSVYACGDFTTAGGGAANRIAKWNGSSWSALGTGLNAGAEKMAIAPNGDLYVCGAFTTAGGVTVNRIAKWDGTSWSALGSGAGGTVDAIAIDKRGILYAGGSFTDIGTRAASWNGNAWTALGSGLGDRPREIFVDDVLGLVWFVGVFTTAGGLTVDRIAIWNGSTWAHPDIDLPGSSTVWEVFVNKDGDIYLGWNDAGNSVASEINTISNEGTEKAYPRLIIKRSGGTSASLKYIKNETTGATLWFDYALLDGETLTIDFRPRRRKIESSLFGNVYGRALLRASDFADFHLLPGDNDISVYVAEAGSPTMTAYLLWRNTHASVDGVAA